jgi:hypothetical protein
MPSKWLCGLGGHALFEYFVWNVAAALLCECCMEVEQDMKEPATRE